MPAARAGGRPRTTDLRQVVDATLYLLRTGYQWPLWINDLTPADSMILGTPMNLTIDGVQPTGLKELSLVFKVDFS